MNALEKLLGGAARMKVIRFFLLSPEKVVTSSELAKVAQVSSTAAVKEIKFLKSIEFIKNATRTDELTKGKITARRKIEGVKMAENFPHLRPLRNLVIHASPLSREKMSKFFRSKAKIKLVALGGIFVDGTLSPDTELPEDTFNIGSRLDLLVVGDGIKKTDIESFVHKIESETGKELVWMCLTVQELDYRMGLHDKFLRDLFDYPHELLVNKLGFD